MINESAVAEGWIGHPAARVLLKCQRICLAFASAGRPPLKQTTGNRRLRGERIPQARDGKVLICASLSNLRFLFSAPSLIFRMNSPACSDIRIYPSVFGLYFALTSASHAETDLEVKHKLPAKIAIRISPVAV
jgi:hypothetical protein